METFALPILVGSLLLVVAVSIAISMRNPPTFWIQEKRRPVQHVRGVESRQKSGGGSRTQIDERS